jgi:hypothetical protein
MPYDLMPARAEHGGHNITRRGVMNAAETFTVGDLVFVNNDGEIAQFPADGTEALLADMDSGRQCGVACNPGVDPSTGTAFNDPRTGAAYATGAEILFWPADQGTLFKTRNVISAVNTPVTPTGVMVGESFQLTFDNTAGVNEWCIETTAGVPGTDVCAIVVQVLDSRGRPISATDTTTGVWVVFEIKTNA